MNPLTRAVREYSDPDGACYVATAGTSASGGAFWFSLAPKGGTRVAYDSGYASLSAAKGGAHRAATGDDHNVGARPTTPWMPVQPGSEIP